MAGRRIKDSVEARSCLASVAASGMDRADWARAQGIDGRSLHAWHLNLTRRPAPRGRFIELVPDARKEPARYLLHFDQLTVELDDGFDDATLARLVGVLAAC